MTPLASPAETTPFRISDPVLLQRLEGAVALVLGVAAYAWLDQSWLVFALLILAPDLFMVGFLRSPRVGALTYNLAHTYAAPALLLLAGPLIGPLAYGIAAIWTAHIGFDRMLGFGLKLGSSFGDTHLGSMGRR